MINQRRNHATGDQQLNIDAKQRSVFANRKASLLFPIISSAICALAFPIATTGYAISEFIAWIICLLCAVGVATVSNRFVFTVVCAILASLIISSTGSAIPLAMMVGPIFSISYGAIAISKTEKFAILPIFAIPAIAYILALAATGNAIIALTALYCAPVAIALGLSNRKLLSKTAATVVGAVAYSGVALITVALYLISAYGAISSEIVRLASNDLAASISQYVESSINATGNAMTADMVQTLNELTDHLINTLVGCFGAYAFISAYICQSIVLTTSERAGDNVKSRNYITCDSAAAVIFVIAYLFSFTTGASGGQSLLAAVGSNVSIILTPCLFIVGLKAIRIMPFRLGLIGLLFSIAVFVLIFISSSSFFTVLALAGACYTLIASVDTWAKNHYSKGESK